MRRFVCTLLATSVVSLAAFSAGAQTQPAAMPAAVPAKVNNASSPITREELPALVRQAILDNPEVIKDAIQKLREKSEAEGRKQAADALAKNKDAMFNDPSSPVAGSTAPDVSIAVFYDYNCPHCRNILPAITDLIAQDPKVRFIFKEYPIFGGDSNTAAIAALAVHRIAKDKYFDFFKALMKNPGKIDSKAINAIAKKMGINEAKLKAEMAKPEINGIIDNNHRLGESLGIRGTPAFVIGDEIIAGEVPLNELLARVAKARSGGGKSAIENNTSAPKPQAPAMAAPRPTMPPANAPAAPPAMPPVAAPAN